MLGTEMPPCLERREEGPFPSPCRMKGQQGLVGRLVVFVSFFWLGWGDERLSTLNQSNNMEKITCDKMKFQLIQMRLVENWHVAFFFLPIRACGLLPCRAVRAGRLGCLAPTCSGVRVSSAGREAQAPPVLCVRPQICVPLR